MKIIKLIVFLLLSCWFLTACQKDIDYFLPDPGQPFGPDTNWYSTINTNMPVVALKNSLLLETKTDSTDISNGLSLITGSGLRLILPAYSLTTGNTGTIVT